MNSLNVCEVHNVNKRLFSILTLYIVNEYDMY